MTQRQRLGRLYQVHEARALKLDAVFKGVGHRRGHGLDAFEWRRKRPCHGLDRVAGKLQKCFVVRVIDQAVAHFRQRAHVGHLFGERKRRCEQVGIKREYGIEQCGVGQFLGPHDGAGDDHVERHFQAQHARQTLGAASPGQQAEFDFRQCNLGTWHRHAVGAAQRQLKPATHAHRVDRRNYRLGR